MSKPWWQIDMRGGSLFGMRFSDEQWPIIQAAAKTVFAEGVGAERASSSARYERLRMAAEEFLNAIEIADPIIDRCADSVMRARCRLREALGLSSEHRDGETCDTWSDDL